MGKETWKEMFLTSCLGKKQSTSMLAASFPSQFDFEVSSICTGPDVIWRLLPLRNCNLAPLLSIVLSSVISMTHFYKSIGVKQ